MYPYFYTIRRMYFHSNKRVVTSEQTNKQFPGHSGAAFKSILYTRVLNTDVHTEAFYKTVQLTLLVDI